MASTHGHEQNQRAAGDVRRRDQRLSEALFLDDIGRGKLPLAEPAGQEYLAT